MKKFLFLIILAIFSMANISFAQVSSIDKFFADKANNDDFTVVSISEKMFGMISNKAESDTEIKEILSKLKGMKILKTDKNAVSFFNAAKSKYAGANYEELMAVREKGSNVVFYVTGSNGKSVKELVLLIGSEKETNIMSFIGEIELDKVSKLGEALDVQGADKLEKFK